MILRGDFSSDILRTTTTVNFMIPEYFTGPYKIVYLLHGLHANSGTWLNNSMLPYYGKKYNAIFVMPDAGRSFYFNMKYGRSYYSYVSEELPQIVKKVFNVSNRREDTAVIGYSMGGHGALKLALSKPDQYGFCGAISSACIFFRPILNAVRTNDKSFQIYDDYETQEIIKDLYAAYGESLEFKPEVDVAELVKIFPANTPMPKIFTTCGTEDSVLKENRKFSEIMKGTSLDFTYEEWAGDHDWDFFNEALRKTLEFWYSS